MHSFYSPKNDCCRWWWLPKVPFVWWNFGEFISSPLHSDVPWNLSAKWERRALFQKMHDLEINFHRLTFTHGVRGNSHVSNWLFAIFNFLLVSCVQNAKVITYVCNSTYPKKSSQMAFWLKKYGDDEVIPRLNAHSLTQRECQRLTKDHSNNRWWKAHAWVSEKLFCCHLKDYWSIKDENSFMIH